MDFTAAYNMASTEITREIYFNIGGPQGFMRWGIYLFLFLSLCYLVYSLRKRIKIWKIGISEKRNNHIFQRLVYLFKNIFFQTKILKEGYAGIMHAGFFFGFLVLFIVTVILLVQEDIVRPLAGINFIYGNFYLIWSLVADIFGVIVLIGLLMAIVRRYIVKPSRLDTQSSDTFLLVLILLIIVSGFISEALRIAITGFPDFEVWSPVGYVLASVFKGSSQSTIDILRKVHVANWWAHMIMAFVFIALLASKKLGHIVLSSFNIFFSNLKNRKAFTKFTHPIINPEEFEEAEIFGVGEVEHFTWKQLLDGDACTRCGRCQDNCPAWLTDKPLSPKKLIIDVKDNMDEKGLKLIKGDTTASTQLIEGSVLIDELWACTNCAACMESCPVDIEHVPKINDMRRYKVLMEGEMPNELRTTFSNMENNFNPYGFAFATRGDWIPEDLEVKSLAEESDVEYLYFVGCAASFDKRNQEVAIAFLRLMKMAGIKVGILGNEESCCGDHAMRAGNEYLFQMLASVNLEKFANYGVKKIITTCPHGYNILRKEYKLFADKGVDSQGEKLQYGFEVFHHAEIINSLLISGKITVSTLKDIVVTYHDSCFLGRYNNMYKQPRDVVKAVVSSNFKEMKKHHEKSFCCGAGGARMFMEENIGTRINHDRTIQAEVTGADIVCTACPFCMTMLSDGIGDLEIDTMQTMDIAELVYKNIKK